MRRKRSGSSNFRSKKKMQKLSRGRERKLKSVSSNTVRLVGPTACSLVITVTRLRGERSYSLAVFRFQL